MNWKCISWVYVIIMIQLHSRLYFSEVFWIQAGSFLLSVLLTLWYWMSYIYLMVYYPDRLLNNMCKECWKDYTEEDK